MSHWTRRETRRDHRTGRAGQRSGGYGLWMLGLVMVAVVGLVLAGCGDPYAELKSEARALEEQNDLEGALEVYGEILAAEPEEGEAVEAAAADLLILGRFDEALVLQERRVALDADDVRTRVELAFNYLNHQARPEDAARVLGEAVVLDPCGQNLTYLGQALIACGDLSAAEQSLRRAIEAEPQYAYAYGVLKGLLAREGRADEAAELVKVAAAQGIDMDEAE